VRLKEVSSDFGQSKVGTALSADWMRPLRCVQATALLLFRQDSVVAKYSPSDEPDEIVQVPANRYGNSLLDSTGE